MQTHSTINLSAPFLSQNPDGLAHGLLLGKSQRHGLLRGPKLNSDFKTQPKKIQTHIKIVIN